MSFHFRRTVWHLVEGGHRDDESRLDWFDWMITTLIVLNVAAFILETEPEVHDRFSRWFHGFEMVSLAVFAVEYLLRIWSCTASARYAHPIFGRLRFAARPLQLIDLIAILPGFLLFLPDLRVIRAFRLLRILRVLKLGRYSQAVTLLSRVLRQRRAELAVMALVMAILVIISASALHYAEADVQPDKFGSIPRSLWWAVITLTTIGYGDVYPITPLGKLLGGLIAVAGIGIVALPTAILASGFSEELKRTYDVKKKAHADHNEAEHPSDRSQAVCPHCGKPIALHAGTAEAV